MRQTTTIDEYRKHIEKDSALERRFQPILITEPTKEETVKILEGLREKYETHHNVKITDEAINAAVDLSIRYITDRFLPDKAIDLIISIIAPILLHGIFDFILMIQYRWSIIVFIVYIVYLWKSSLDKLDEYTNNSRKKFLKRYKFIRHKKRKDD